MPVGKPHVLPSVADDGSSARKRPFLAMSSDPLDPLVIPMTGPVRRNVEYVEVEVDVAKFDAISGEFYDALTLAVFSRRDEASIMSRADFQIVNRWALKMRLDVVLLCVKRVTRYDAVPFYPVTLFGPLAQLINNFGLVTICDGTRIVFPAQPRMVRKGEPRIDTLCTPAILTAYNNMVSMVNSRISMGMEQMSGRPEGTPFWMLKVVGIDGVVPVDRETFEVGHVVASFREWSPRDASLAVIMFRGVAVDPINDQSVFYRSTDLTCIPAVRSHYFQSYLPTSVSR